MNEMLQQTSPVPKLVELLKIDTKTEYKYLQYPHLNYTYPLNNCTPPGN